MTQITFYGHACFEVEIAGKKLLFDPFITGNDLASHIDITTINPDYILVTHGHQDHVLDVAAIAKQSGAKLISNFEIVTWFNNQGIDNAHPMNHGGAFDFDFGRVKYVQAIHTSSMPDGSYGGQPGGFVITHKDGAFYHSGDTALTMDMKLIGEEFDLDFAMLCLGDNFTMGITDAVKAADFIQCNTIVGMHFDTFPPIKIDHDEAIRQFENAGKKLILAGIGQTISI